MPSLSTSGNLSKNLPYPQDTEWKNPMAVHTVSATRLKDFYFKLRENWLIQLGAKRQNNYDNYCLRTEVCQGTTQASSIHSSIARCSESG